MDKTNEEPWMKETLDLTLEKADIDLLEFLSDITAYPKSYSWVEGLIESLKESHQFPHRVEGFFERIFNACNKSYSDDKRDV